jgi:hypothetical protein
VQTRWQSLLESFANVAIGYLVALLAQLLVFPLFGIHIPLAQNLAIGGIFTVVSIARSYGVRRLFKWIHSHETHTNNLHQGSPESPAQDLRRRQAPRVR